MSTPTKKSPKTLLSNGTDGTFGAASAAKSLRAAWRPSSPATCGMLQQTLSEMHRGHCTCKPRASRSPVSPAEIPGKQAHQPARFLQHSQGTAGMTLTGRAPRQRSGAKPAASSCTSLHAFPSCPSQTRAPAWAAERLFFSLSGRSQAPAPQITQAPTSYSNGHKRKRLNRFSFLEKTALPAASCPPQPALPAAQGAGTWHGAGRCPKVPEDSFFGQSRQSDHVPSPAFSQLLEPCCSLQTQDPRPAGTPGQR